MIVGSKTFVPGQDTFVALPTGYEKWVTVHVEFSAVCKFRGFHGHIRIQQKFNPWKIVSLQQLQICNST